MTDTVLTLFGKQVEQFEPLLHNIVNPTTIIGADNPFRIPEKINIVLNCYLLPGYTTEDILREINSIVGKDIEIEVLDYLPFYQPVKIEPDMGLFDTLAEILSNEDPEGIPIPLLVPFMSDGRFFAQLGIQTYGFLPMNFSPNFEIWRLTHGPDERIPVEALHFGTNAIFKLLQRFGK
jgi:acetylornithine deacetylase/succinyl-diaminopimelate desuccinylase-like protein